MTVNSVFIVLLKALKYTHHFGFMFLYKFLSICVEWNDNLASPVSPSLFFQSISQAFQFFVPIGAGTGLHLPSSMFIGQTSDKRASPDLSADEQLACRWKKVGPCQERRENTFTVCCS